MLHWLLKSLYVGIFVDNKGVNCMSLEIVHEKKFTQIKFEEHLDR